jgi:DNA-binding NarL/FixJ family response regulator
MPIEGPVRVLVVDDRVGSVGAAATAEEAIAQARELQPHVVVLDVNLGGEDGLALIPALQRAAPCEIMVLTSLADPHVAAHARLLGARACLHKTAPAVELLASILAACRVCDVVVAATPTNTGVALSYVNGTGVRRMAARLGKWLASQGVHTDRLTHQRPFVQRQTVIPYRAGHERAAQRVARSLPVTQRFEPVLFESITLSVR